MKTPDDVGHFKLTIVYRGVYASTNFLEKRCIRSSLRKLDVSNIVRALNALNGTTPHSLDMYENVEVLMVEGLHYLNASS